VATDREVKLILSVATKGSEAVKNLFSGGVSPGGSAALKGIAESIGGMKDQQAKWQAVQKPEIAKAMASAELDLAKAREKGMKALAEEKAKLQGGPGFFGRIKAGLFGGAGAAGGGGAGAGKGALGGLASGAMGTAAALGGLGAAIVGLGAAANPAAFDRMNAAFADLAATVGRVFAPLLDIVGDAFRVVGDVLASILPSASEMRELFEPFRDLFKSIGDVLKELAPIFKPFVEIFKVLMIPVQWVAKALAEFAKQVAETIRQLRKVPVVGRMFGKEEDKKSSFGAAAKGVTSIGIAELGDKARMAAFGAAGGARGTQEKIAENTEQSNGYLRRIADAMDKGGGKAGIGQFSAVDWATGGTLRASALH
jgi:hypothetical protein